MNIDIYIDGKKAHGLMLKHKTKEVAVKYGIKLDHWFVTGGQWLKDEQVQDIRGL